MDIGIDVKHRQQIADGLSKVLADTYTLYLKTHNFHWNVTGPMFQTLHLMFEQHYNELALAVDALAERIRALGFPAPGTYRQFAALSSIREEDGIPKATDMIRLLVEGHEAVHDGRRGQRSAHLRSPHPAHADPREDCLDAPQPARVSSPG